MTVPPRPIRLRDLPERVNEVSGDVLDAAITVQNEIGNMLLESAYRDCLAHELRSRGRDVVVEGDVPLTYRGLVLPKVYRSDLVVDGCVVVEVKAVEAIVAEHEAQAITYAHLLGIQLAIVLNFRASRIKDGFRRLAISQGLRELSAVSAPLRVELEPTRSDRPP